MKNIDGFLEKLDTSNFPKDHPCFSDLRTKIPGTFTDESRGKYISELIALRSKSYGYNLAGVEKIKAKGVAAHAVKNHMSIQDHKLCLFNGLDNITPTDYTPYRDMITFRSYKHEIHTITSRKLALNRYDDKRFVLQDQIKTLAHGHYRIE